MTTPLVVAVDGGNFKTDLAVARASGEVLAFVRGPQSSPYYLGADGCLDVVDELLAHAFDDAGLVSNDHVQAQILVPTIYRLLVETHQIK